MNKNIILAAVFIIIIGAIYFLGRPRQSSNTLSEDKSSQVSINPIVLAGSLDPLYDFYKPTYDQALKSGLHLENAFHLQKAARVR